MGRCLLVLGALFFAALTVYVATTNFAEALPKPNIVFILVDDQNAQDYDTAMKTVQSRMEAKGAKVPATYYSMSRCCPSRASILRGQYTHNTGVWGNDPPHGGYETWDQNNLGADTYATRLNSAGYYTGYFGKFLNGYPERGSECQNDPTPASTCHFKVEPGWDTWFASLGPPQQATFVNSSGDVVDYNGNVDAHTYLRASTWLQDALNRDAPVLATINFFAPHAPAQYPDSYADKFSGEPLPQDASFDEDDMSDKPEWMRQFGRIDSSEKQALADTNRDRLRSSAYADAKIGDILDIVGAAGEPTYILFYSDNGYHLGQHRLPSQSTGGKSAPYTEDVRYPLIVRGPGIEDGASISGVAQNVDIRATLEDMGGAFSPAYEDGYSLLGALKSGGDTGRNMAYIEKLADTGPSWKAVYSSSHSFVLTNDGHTEMYTKSTDPDQINGFTSDAELAERTKLRDALGQFATCRGSECYAAGR